MPLSERRVVGFATGDAATAAFLWRVSRCSGGEGFVFDADAPRVWTFVCGSVDNRFERRVVGVVVVSSEAITTGVELRVCRLCGGV